VDYEHIPAWVPAPPEAAIRGHRGYAVVVIDHPSGAWTAATREEIEALLDEESFLGKMLVGHTALMSLWYLSNN
jgi:hypothetical protein